MKLSEILGWRKELNLRKMKFPEQGVAFNTALTSCDREIDREALAKVIYSLMDFTTKWEDVGYEEKQVYLSEADTIISTMPTWLKRSEK